MEKIPFCKMSGCGNDFILIDNRSGRWSRLETPAFVRAVCREKLSVGADGLIFIEKSDAADFKWEFFNSDGSRAEMCGNGARCAARFAVLNGITGTALSFETIAGIIHAEVHGAVVKTQLSRPRDLQLGQGIEVEGRAITVHSINTGVPHAVIFADDLEGVPIKELGATIRFHEHFQPAGTNVNFISIGADGSISIRTYERGVEDETLACGTGSVAAALVCIAMGRAASPALVKTRGGDILKVYAEPVKPPFSEVYLEGAASLIYTGEICPEAYTVQ
jgi:diaminopimelate epimerase